MVPYACSNDSCSDDSTSWWSFMFSMRTVAPTPASTWFAATPRVLTVRGPSRQVIDTSVSALVLPPLGMRSP